MSRYYPPVTVTGNPVNFSAPNGGKLDSVSVQIIPTQDLHGYANPWPAGGGVNILDPDKSSRFSTTAYGMDITYLGDDTFTIKGQSTTTGASAAFNVLWYSDTSLSGLGYVVQTFIVNDKNNNYKSCYGFRTSTEKAIAVVLDCSVSQDVDITLKFSVATASQASWTPYENICPISGRTGLSVYVSPTQDPDDATVYNVDWTTQAGTVYGGTLDVVTGVLTVDRAIVDMGGRNYTKGNRNTDNTGYVFYFRDTSFKDRGELISSQFKEVFNIPNLESLPVNCCNSAGGSYIVFCADYSDAAAFKTAMSGVQLCYELATPLTYQLTPKQIAALIDQNYIWSSNNETISVVYALLVPGSDKYTLIVNGVDIADFVERDSYRTTLYPVFSEAVQTLDGVGHTALLRKKGELSARFNPRTAADTAIICAALLNAPCEVQYHCLQRNADVTALMTIDSVSALYLSRCLYCRQKWNDIDSITLTEL